MRRVSELRNRGGAPRHRDVLAFVDADNEIVVRLGLCGDRDSAMPRVGAVGALCHAPVDGTWVQRAYGYLRGRTEAQHDVAWLGSGNLAVWRQVFDAVGGFDTSLETCEDVDLCHRIRASGLRIVSDARLGSVHHGDPRTLSDLFASERWRGRDNLRVSFRRPVVWASVPSAIVPIVDALMLGAAVLGMVAALAGLDAWAPGNRRGRSGVRRRGIAEGDQSWMSDRRHARRWHPAGVRRVVRVRSRPRARARGARSAPRSRPRTAAASS